MSEKQHKETPHEDLKLPLLQKAVIHKFNNKGHKAEAKNKRRKKK